MDFSSLKQISLSLYARSVALSSVFGVVLMINIISMETAKAVSISHDYEALITRIQTTGNLGGLDDIEVGLVANQSVVSGSFSYDTAQASLPLSGFTLFRNGPNAITLDVSGFSFLFDTPINTRVLIGDSLPFGTPPNDGFRDVFGTDGYENEGSGLITQTIIGIELIDSTDNAFSQQSSLPTALLLSDFDDTGFRFILRNYFNGSSSIIGSITLEGSIVALQPSAVPIPAALPLFGTGLALMGFFGWRRKRKPTAAT